MLAAFQSYSYYKFIVVMEQMLCNSIKYQLLENSKPNIKKRTHTQIGG